MVHFESANLYLASGQALEKVRTKGLELSLLATGDGTEVIHHRLDEGARWALVPEDGWEALEFLYVLEGELTLHNSTQKGRVLKQGDVIFSVPVQEESIFVANTKTDFLYISSRPVWHNYSNIVRNIQELAINVEQKDGYTADHCQRIMELSMRVGETMHLPSDQLYNLNLGSFLHDIGKVRVPDHILGKPGKLTDDEWAIMRLHTVYGRQILEETNLSFLRQTAHIVEQHHERFDGRGYPHRLRGEEICIEACIIAVVDSFDAMISNRVYKMARSTDEALEEIRRGNGTMYHPLVVEAFLQNPPST